ncbi:MAG TPA: type II secretion system F family protein, partial [Noviherbaspirillum sp.]
MTITSMLYLAAIFVAVFGGSLLLLGVVLPSKTGQRLKSLSADDTAANSNSSSQWVAKVAKMTGPLAKLSIPDEQDSLLRQRFMQAGFRHSDAPTLFFASKTLLAVALPALLWLAITGIGGTLSMKVLLTCLLVAAAAGFYLPNYLLTVIVRRRQREIFDVLPNAMDLMTICVEAGLNIDAAISRVAQEITLTSRVLGEELHLVTLELRAGNSKEKALRNLALR